MTRDDFRRRADAVRDVPLETVLQLRAARRDPRDRSKWDTERGPLSVTGAKFINWHCHLGGGGAIDLVMHLAAVDWRKAVVWLERHVTGGYLRPPEVTPSPRSERSVIGQPQSALRLPPRDDRLLGRVRTYLTANRHLAASLLEPLLQSGKLYADHRGNAVFLLVAGKAQRPVGAELRGTGPRIWRGMAPGTRKEEGYFWTGVPGSREIVLCESAIDAISCFQIHPECICLSTSGARANPPWLSKLIDRGYHIRCGFDTDEAGEFAATQMITLHPVVQRLRPLAHDWNDTLALRE
ncbi:MAG: DUF3991 domain-containing protein [SAR202 cluster bacterium]|nr:DUF3991 domain-containing protein [SAR202 cluster bacterium]